MSYEETKANILRLRKVATTICSALHGGLFGMDRVGKENTKS